MAGTGSCGSFNSYPQVEGRTPGAACRQGVGNGCSLPGPRSPAHEHRGRRAQAWETWRGHEQALQSFQLNGAAASHLSLCDTQTAALWRPTLVNSPDAGTIHGTAPPMRGDYTLLISLRSSVLLRSAASPSDDTEGRFPLLLVRGGGGEGGRGGGGSLAASPVCGGSSQQPSDQRHKNQTLWL